jgi:hypothetical protein
MTLLSPATLNLAWPPPEVNADVDALIEDVDWSNPTRIEGIVC